MPKQKENHRVYRNEPRHNDTTRPWFHIIRSDYAWGKIIEFHFGKLSIGFCRFLKNFGGSVLIRYGVHYLFSKEFQPFT